MRISQKTFVAAGLLVLMAMGGVQTAVACSSPPPPQPPITIDFHEVCFDLQDPTKCMIKAWITIHGYTTFGSGSGSFCACALKQVPKIKEVRYARFYDPATGLRYPAFPFDSDGNVSTNASVIAGGGTFGGFLTSPTCVGTPTGQPLDLMFEVVLEGGTMLETWAPQLQVPALVVTAGSNPNGALIDHIGILNNNPQTGGCQVAGINRAFLNGAENLAADRGTLKLRACVKGPVIVEGTPTQPTEPVGLPVSPTSLQPLGQPLNGSV